MQQALVEVRNELGRGGALCKEFNRVRLSDKLNWRVEMFYALDAMERSPQLQKCDASTIGRAIIDAGVLGVSLSPAKKEAYLIPYNMKVGPNTWENRASLSISYMGMEQIAYRTGFVKLIQTNLVRQGDAFEVWTDDNGRHIQHKENMVDQGKVTHAYCVIKLSSGEDYVEIMTRRELDAVKEAAAKKNNGSVPFVWTGDFRTEMYRKSVLRRAWKHIPRSENSRVSNMLEAVERTDPVAFEKDEKVVTESPYIDGDDIDVLVEMMKTGGVPDQLHNAWLSGLASGLGYKQGMQCVLKKDFDRAVEGMTKGIEKWKASQASNGSGSKPEDATSQKEAT